MGKYRSAIVGCGRIGSLFSKDELRTGVVTHAAAYRDNPDTELVAACDIDAERLEAFGRDWGIKALYTDFEEMLIKENIDIVSICTWDATHYDLLKKASGRGVKAIFCEKPVSDNLKNADEMVKICGEKDIVLAVNHSRRWDALEQKVKAYMDSGKLGRIQKVNAYYTAGLANTGTHLLDLLRFFFGEVKWVWANPETDNGSPDPSPDGCMFFQQGFTCFLNGLDAKEYLIFEIDIYGTLGRIRIKNSGFDLATWGVCESPRFSGYRELEETEPFAKDGYKDVLKNAVADIVSCLKEKRTVLSSGEDGARTLELICALRESLKNGGERISLPLKDRDITIKTK